MHSVITVIAPSNTACPSVEAASLVRALGGDIASEGWVEPGVAYDIILTHAASDALKAGLQTAATGWHVDIITQGAATRRKKLVISDMDSTMIDEECIDELADMVGKKAEVSAITERAMRGELDFAAALTERVAMLKGLAVSELQRVLAERIHLSPGAVTLVQTMKAHGARSLLVSGGFTFFTGAIAAQIGFDDHAGNTLEIANNALTGRVAPPILDKFSKLESLQHACSNFGFSAEEVLALGDGANDLPMLQAAGLGVAYRAKPAVRAAAKAQLNYCDLAALLYAQGFARANWASS